LFSVIGMCTATRPNSQLWHATLWSIETRHMHYEFMIINMKFCKWPTYAIFLGKSSLIFGLIV
jgi:hypothetical protein